MDNEHLDEQLPDGTDQEDLETLLEWGEAFEQSGHGTLLITMGEWLCYGLAGVAVLLLFAIHKTYPFSVLTKLFSDDTVYNGTGPRNFNFLVVALYGCYLLIPMALALLGRALQLVNARNGLLRDGGEQVRDIAERLHQRRLNQSDSPTTKTGNRRLAKWSNAIGKGSDVNDMANPGFGD